MSHARLKTQITSSSRARLISVVEAYAKEPYESHSEMSWNSFANIVFTELQLFV